jgi:hypothetical protein
MAILVLEWCTREEACCVETLGSRMTNAAEISVKASKAERTEVIASDSNASIITHGVECCLQTELRI